MSALYQKIMHVSDFHFELPNELIARYPTEKRSASRLLHVDGVSGDCCDKQFQDILTFAQSGDLMVFNDTRVIPARLFGQKDTGGKLELLVERILDDHRFLAHVKASKPPKENQTLHFEQDVQMTMLARHDALFELKVEGERKVLDVLNDIGHMPLPPYMERPDEDSDWERYQTVYNAKPGAVAAPTAGLHFDEFMLAQLKEKGVEFAYVTLHVGAGTFQPVRVDNIDDHHMHSEYAEVSQEVVEQILATKKRGGRVIAVGTTSVRSLESAAKASHGELKSFYGDTDIFIYPGFKFKVIDALLTNFHLPESTLIMLVSAFAGYDVVMAAYEHAVKERYRFFSYGDAMLLTRAS